MSKRIWEIFPQAAKKVAETHLEVGLIGHHDWQHAFRVGEVARMVALDEWGDEHLSYLAGLAGLCHNADRLIQKKLGVGRKEVAAIAVEALITDWLGGCVDTGEIVEIIVAVLEHDGKNNVRDSNILIALMDGDRIVNLDSDLFPRSGQYYHDLPVVDYKHFLDDPEATYRNPKTVLRDIAYSLEWADPTSSVCVRTRLGTEMAARRAGAFRTVVEALREQLKEEGLFPYPFED